MTGGVPLQDTSVLSREDETHRDHAGQCRVLTLQLLAGTVVVVAFACAQADRLDRHGMLYLLANATSTGVLAAVALVEAQYGFVMTNGFWAAISTFGLVRVARGGRADVGSSPEEAAMAVSERGPRPLPSARQQAAEGSPGLSGSRRPSG